MNITVKVACPDDVGKLPWAGNFADDLPLAHLVNAYIMQEPDLGKRQRADELCVWHMCGEEIKLVGTELDPRNWCDSTTVGELINREKDGSREN